MRLIDADALIEEIESLSVHVKGLRNVKTVFSEYVKHYKESVLRMIDEQPTAYDVEKVVELINRRIEFLDGMNKVHLDAGNFKDADRMADRMAEVIAIRKIVLEEKEQEIRNKAIDEFAEALINHINEIPSRCIGGANVRRIAELMKEGAV